MFNGIINPECMPAGGPTALTLDSAALSSCGQGALTLSGGGDLHMVIDGNEGPSYAFVDSLTVNSDGTLELDLPPAVGTAPIGTYPQIFAETATLNAGGTLIANIEAGQRPLRDHGLRERDRCARCAYRDVRPVHRHRAFRRRRSCSTSAASIRRRRASETST